MPGQPTSRSEARRLAIGRSARPHVVAAGRAIVLKLDDARAHAETTLTPALVNAVDGRKTLERASQSRGLANALARLDALWAALAGPPGADVTSGIIRDAWEAAFRDAWEHARREADPADRNDLERPSARMLQESRRIVLEGYDARGLMRGSIERARNTLSALIPRVATTTIPARTRLDFLRSWQLTSARAIAQAARLAILTGAFRQDARAARLVLRPELLHDDPSIEVIKS